MKNKDYRSRSPIKLLDRDYILANVHNYKFDLDVFTNINSTNKYLEKMPVEKIPRFCLAEHQTLGRGRLGRDWYSPFGLNIYLSCSYLFKKDISDLSVLSLVVALAVSDLLKKFLPPDQIRVKWPNDIIFDDKKIAGILINNRSLGNEESSAVIGIGLNVNIKNDETGRIQQAWTSMSKVVGIDFDRNEICVMLIENLLKYLKNFSTRQLNFIKEWQKVDYLFGKNITVKSSKEKNVGIAKGVDGLGRLLLEFPSGKIKRFSSGDISINY